MSQFVPFYYTSSKSSIVSWDNLLENESFCSLEAPVFSCADFEDIFIKDLSTLGVVDLVNRARAGGVDSNNIDALCGEFARGYRSDRFPPVLMVFPNGSIELWDGYNRYNVCKLMKIESFPFAVYHLKKEWETRIEDAYDIVSLGLNNHPRCKPATLQDFVTRAIVWVKRQPEEMKKKDVIAWVNGISHSWNKGQVETIASQVYQQTTIATTITPYTHPKIAKAWVSNNIDTQSSTNPLVVCCKEDGYVERAFLQVMKNYIGNAEQKIDPIDITDIIVYTKACETSEQVESQREFAFKYLKQMDHLVLQYAAKRMANQGISYQVIGALPQLNDIEDLNSLVKFDLDSVKKA